MTTREDFTRQVWRTALLTVGLLAATMTVPGIQSPPASTVIPKMSAASLIGLGRQIPVINKLCRKAPPSPPHGTPTG